MSIFSPTTAERLKTYATAFIATATAIGIVVTPIAVWAIGEIEDIAKQTLRAEAPQIVDIRMNHVFDNVYKSGFADLDSRTRRMDRRQLEFQNKFQQLEKDNTFRDKLQQEKLKGINEKLDMLIEQMRRNQRNQ